MIYFLCKSGNDLLITELQQTIRNAYKKVVLQIDHILAFLSPKILAREDGMVNTEICSHLV